MDSAPVWVKLWHVPLELYSQQGLGYVASAVGKPLYSDQATAMQQQLEFTKVCVEVQAKEEVPSSVMIDLGNANFVNVAVEVVWSPPKCKLCAVFGHSDEKCRRHVTEKLIDPLDDSEVSVESGAAEVVPAKDGVEVTGDMETMAGCGECSTPSLGENLANKEVVQSANSFELASLEKGGNTVEDDGLIGGVLRKERVAAAGVAELMQQLKPKVKEPQKQGKGHGGGTKGNGKKGGDFSPDDFHLEC
ncbi:hypothetical protein HRI_002503800 [Hibiscus trionum]|uniref:DUF4283 domain-containing protein n=1 Tax=Hibiscus trionum TaxID=183268 RepID=A0A9W7I6B1_HIBTR|nr:hypothetical protein HRI_002503800 [Hibiscus trionum]